METVIFQYETKPDAADDNQRLVERVFTQLVAADPGGLRYASFRLADGVTFVHVALFEGENNPLPGTAAFQEFQHAIADRCVQPPARAAATVIGTYRFGLE
jgi:hypothetical protein